MLSEKTIQFSHEFASTFLGADALYRAHPNGDAIGLVIMNLAEGLFQPIKFADIDEALAHLLYGVSGGGGFVLLTGEIGAGKTTVCRAFLDQVPPRCAVAYIFNPKLSVVELLQTICEEFGVELPKPAAPGLSLSAKEHVDALNRYLLAAHAAGGHTVLIIDEAQSLAADVLEQLRLLTNLETAEKKLLQIVLIGQPELREMLARPELEQLAQRVIARYHLPALSVQ